MRLWLAIKHGRLVEELAQTCVQADSSDQTVQFHQNDRDLKLKTRSETYDVQEEEGSTCNMQ